MVPQRVRLTREMLPMRFGRPWLSRAMQKRLEFFSADTRSAGCRVTHRLTSTTQQQSFKKDGSVRLLAETTIPGGYRTKNDYFACATCDDRRRMVKSLAIKGGMGVCNRRSRKRSCRFRHWLA